MLITVDNDRYRLEAPIRYKDVINHIPGAQFDKVAWYVPNRPLSACVMLSVAQELGIPLDAAAKTLSSQASDGFYTTQGIKHSLPDAKFRSASGKHAFPEQLAHAQFLSSGTGMDLSEPGTGKTITALLVLTLLEHQGDVLIVAPEKVLVEWKRAVDDWLGWSVAIVTGTKTEQRKALESGARITLCGYSLMTKHSRLARYGSISMSEEDITPKALNGRFDTVILDEAHKIKNAKSKQARAAWAIGDEAKHRFILTGTPVSNSPLDIWSLLRFIEPALFKSSSRFRDRYAQMVTNYSGYDECLGILPHRKLEFDFMVASLAVRRTKAQMLPHLPEKTYTEIEVEMSGTQRKLYKELKERSFIEIDDELLVSSSQLTVWQRLSTLSSATPVIEDGEIVALKAPSSKIDALMELLENEEPAVVFAESRKLLDLAELTLKKTGISYSYIKGGQSAKTSQSEVDRFQAGETRVCLVVLAAGAAGLTLTRAARAIYLQRSYSLILSMQSEDRIHRIGQLAPKVEIIDLVAKDSIESKVYEALRTKTIGLYKVVQDERANDYRRR